MNKPPTISIYRFVRGLTVYTLIIGIISYAIRHWVPELKISHAYLFILLFVYLVTLLILWLLGKSMESRLSRFANAFMLLNFGKLLLYTIAIFVYAYLNREDAVSFIITFFIYYLLFTAYEVYVLLKVNSSKRD
jgi:membrane protein CcdC involved in cytochrome C biogenesis